MWWHIHSRSGRGYGSPQPLSQSMSCHAMPSHAMRGKSTEKVRRTFLVSNLPRHYVLKEVRKFCTCFLWYFVQSLMDTTDNMYRHYVLRPYCIFCAFFVLKCANEFVPVCHAMLCRATPRHATPRHAMRYADAVPALLRHRNV